ncbi:MAG: aminomethyl-transferring glycine dehydrogenase subunit GcvPB [Aquificaceae bacterium]
MKLIFETSRRGRRGYKLPKLDTPHVNLEEYLGDHIRKDLNLPEVSELDAVRHYTNLSKLNYSVDTNFYPLGSCSMKYNPRICEEVSSLDGFKDLHPMVDDSFAQGSLETMYRLKELRKELGGFSDVSLQPAAGAHGEFLGLLLTLAYHKDKGNSKRKVLVPDSAHGTNPASAAMCGFEVVTVKSDEKGELSWKDFLQKLDDNTAGLMLTNPNTLGIFERKVKQIAEALHQVDALLYMDGANFNSIVGISRPGDWGVDIMHFNLHKTFGTPHGGGGPGGGALGVSEKLRPYLPVPQVEFDGKMYFLNWDIPKSVGKIMAFYGNFSVMLRALAYIMSYGSSINTVAKHAVLNARYLRHLLKDTFLDPYEHVPCMHEFVLSLSPLTKYEVSPMDVAKKLLDYGFYAPTVYFPLVVKDAFMIEPTETENPDTLRAFARALKEIAKKAREDPQEVKSAPTKTPVRRIKEAEANRKPVLNFGL